LSQSGCTNIISLIFLSLANDRLDVLSV